MTSRFRLLNPTLQFVPYGKGRIHARWWHKTNTFCGRPITSDMKNLSEREIDVQKLCQNCYSSLRTYGPQVELVSEEVEA